MESVSRGRKILPRNQNTVRTRPNCRVYAKTRIRVYSNLNAVTYFGSTTRNETARPDDLNWIMQFGYGIVSGITVNFDEFIPPPDPNAEMLESFSENERAAFDVALNGALETRFQPGAIELTGSELRAARANQGCAGMASVTAEDSDPRELLSTDEFWPLQSGIIAIGT